MTTISILYHQEFDHWWAESPDVDGFLAVGASLGQVRTLVKEGMPFYLDKSTVELTEEFAGRPGPVVDLRLELPATADTMAGGWVDVQRMSIPVAYGRADTDNPAKKNLEVAGRP